MVELAIGVGPKNSPSLWLQKGWSLVGHPAARGSTGRIRTRDCAVDRSNGRSAAVHTVVGLDLSSLRPYRHQTDALSNASISLTAAPRRI